MNILILEIVTYQSILNHADSRFLIKMLINKIEANKFNSHFFTGEEMYASFESLTNLFLSCLVLRLMRIKETERL